MSARRSTDPCNGAITVVSQLRSGTGEIGEIYEWRPPVQSRGHFPDSYVLRMTCASGTFGRVFAPEVTFLEFLVKAASAGATILSDQLHWSADERYAHREASLLFQFARHTREFAVRRFKSLRELRPKLSDGSRQDILPEDLGLNEKGEGEHWNPSKLLREGRVAVNELGISNCSTEQALWHGLLRAAKRNPLYVGKPALLVRGALFATGSASGSVDERLLMFVREQVAEIFAGHLADSTELFGEFLRNKKANLLGRISKRKRTPVGSLTRELARSALAEISFEALLRMAVCVEAQMRAFSEALATPLSDSESQIFELLFCRQSFLGNLPLVLLQEQLRFLSPAIDWLCVSPKDRRRIAVIHRLLLYYSQMVEERRADDREYQQRRLHKNQSGSSARFQRLSDLAGTQPLIAEDSFHEIVRGIAIQRGIADNQFFAADWQAYVISEDDPIEIHLVSGSSQVEFVMPRDEFIAAARSLVCEDES